MERDQNAVDLRFSYKLSDACLRQKLSHWFGSVVIDGDKYAAFEVQLNWQTFKNRIS